MANEHRCELTSRFGCDVCGEPATKKVRDTVNDLTFWACDFHYEQAADHPDFET